MHIDNLLIGLRKKAVIVLLSVLVVAVVSSTACSRSSDEARPEKKLTRAKNDELNQKLNSLKINVDIDYFNGTLGDPAVESDRNIQVVSYSIKRHGQPKKVVEELKYKEYFYFHEHYVIQAVTDEADKVGMYSITARNAGYFPKIETVLGEPVHLGQSVYDALPGKPRKVAGILAAQPRNSRYYEIFSINSEEHPFVIFSSNPLGYFQSAARLDQKDSGILVSRFSDGADDFPIHDMHGEFRKSTTINTYSVVASWFEGIDMSLDGVNFSEVMINFGPRVDQVSLAD